MPGSITPQHVVRFFDRDEDLCQSVAEFTAEGLARRERVLLLITAAHWADVHARLTASGADAARLVASGEVAIVDAEAVLLEIIADGFPRTERFGELMTHALSRLVPPYRVFGELVSLLTARGHLRAALDAEELGHQLAHAASTSVLCAYDLRHLRVEHGDVQRVAACHDAALNVPAPHGPVVLLADDFEDARALYKEYLEFRGCRAVTAADGLEALRLARTCRPAVIFLDIRMPRMSGIEAMEALRADPALARTPIVALTAHALQSERDLFIAKGFDAVLTKPCAPSQLIVVMEELLPGLFASLSARA